jgi:hypothetical protein
MKKVIDGKEYKQLEVKKMVVNGKEISGNIISPENVSESGEIRIGIIADTVNEDETNK